MPSEEYACTKEFYQKRKGRFPIEESKALGTSVLHGLIAIFTLAIVSSFIFALILRFTSLQESSVQYVMTAISFIALFTGGFISGGKGKQRGWMLGGITGAIYTIIIFLFQYLGFDKLFNPQQIVYFICYILIAMMGGILGVNMSSKSK
ncbi:TIGR04086 family membrane protein [Cytobacillus kochii]|uniref:TIGR04086 family membrane protein n=1 Tax=Cytobacillus TaxID=2675230 RepID=UPI00278306AA|nr:TIGR04086 family membrane protein [Cytobacillus kochii]MDQ0183585.1 putative membrane protein (TIGR04086 family) [Cytobacillus kochii]